MTYANASEPIRVIHGQLYEAARTSPIFGKQTTSRKTPAQASGIRYERNCQRALDRLAKRLGSSRVEHNPYFAFRDEKGVGVCSPDSIFWLEDIFALVIEVKSSWVATAPIKLARLYAPVVNLACQPKIVRTMVLCRNLSPGCPQPIEDIINGTLLSLTSPPVYQWNGQGNLIWETQRGYPRTLHDPIIGSVPPFKLPDN